MTEIASAFISIAPSMRGFGSSLESQASGQVSRSGGLLGGILGKAMLVGFAAAGVAAGVGKALYEVGQTFDDVNDTIMVGTGATGAALASLEASAKTIGKTTPSAFSDIGSAVTQLNQRLGITGPPLERLSSQMLNLSRITETDLSTNIADMTRVFGDWGIKMRDQPAALDAIFKASQETGAGINDLAQSVVRMGAPLRQFGFSFEEGLAIFGKWEKEGVNAQTVMAGLKIGLGQFSKAGLEPRKALDAVSAAIKNAGSAGEANQIAIKAFGQRAGPDMAAAVREGRFAIGDLVKTISESDGAIAHADLRSRDFAESWQVFKNQVLVGLEPIATRVFDAFNTFAISAMPKIISGFQSVSVAVNTFVANLRSGEGSAGQFGTFIRDRALPALRQFGDFVRNQVVPALREFGTFILTKVVPPVRDALVASLAKARTAFNSIKKAVQDNRPQLEQLGSALKKVAAFILTKVWPAIIRIQATALPLLGKAISFTIRNIAFLVDAFNKGKAAFDRIKGAIDTGIAKFTLFAVAVRQKVSNVISTVKALPGKIKAALGDAGRILYDAGRQIIQGLIDGILSQFGKLKSTLGEVGGFIKDHKGPPAKDKVMLFGAGQLIMDGLIDGIESRKGALGDALEKVGKKVKEKVAKIRDQLATVRSDFASLVEPIASNFTQGLFDFDTASAFTANLTTVKGTLQTLLGNFKKLIGEGLNPGFLYQLFQSGGPGLINSLAGLDAASAQSAGGLFSDVMSLSDQLGTAVAGSTDKGAALETQTTRLEAKLEKLIKHVDASASRTGVVINSTAAAGHRRGK